MATMIEVDGWCRWVSEIDGGLLNDGLAIVTPNMPLPSNYPEALTDDQKLSSWRLSGLMICGDCGCDGCGADCGCPCS